MKPEAYFHSNNQMYLDEKNKSKGRIKATPGIWIEGKTYWLWDASEKLIPNEAISIQIRQEHKHSKIIYFEIFVRNHLATPRNVKLIMMHHYDVTGLDHLAFVSPTDNVIFHLADDIVHLVNGHCRGDGMEQRTIQPLWNLYSDRLWNNSEKGVLKYQPMGKGATASIFTLNMNIDSKETCECSSWVISSRSKLEVMGLNHVLLKNTLAFPNEK
ncbi:hypothetical protein [Bacillus sp. 03113]|uniref:hypothetical protein n=1 Tax=Bacillus sp. 03113 TaxID=2578211 RepID=UPI001143EB84|nr:hypothetical protein [Bacillus sp. 03113]